MNNIDNYYNEEDYYELYKLLKIKLSKYTLNSTVPIGIAKSINLSNIWTINFYLKNNNKNINDTSIEDLYKTSYKYLCDYVNKTKLFYNLVVKPNMIKTNNYFYKETLNEGISSFFKVYNTSYDAKNKCILVDYNSYLKIDNLYGIEFINKYLEYINYENIFLNNFDYKKIDNLLTNIYGNYEEIPINIFSTVLIIVILLEYLNKNVNNLDITNIFIDKIYNDYQIDNKLFINNLYNSYNRVLNKLKLDNKTINYLEISINNIIKEIIINIKNKKLDYLLDKKKNKEIIYKDNNKLDNNKYLELINKLNNNIDRVDLIKNNTNSLFDIIDIISDIDLTYNELNKLFSSFNILELMVIKKYAKNEVIEKLNNYLITRNKTVLNYINNNYKYITLR